MTAAAERARQLVVRLPLLDATAGHSGLAEPNLDWPHAEYEVEVRPQTQSETHAQWNVHHVLTGAAPLLEAVEAGNAAYAVTAVCKRTVWTRQFVSDSPTTEVTVARGEAHGDINLYPRMIATREFEIDFEDSDISALWRGLRLTIPEGRVLAMWRPIPVRADGKGGRAPYELMPDRSVPAGEIRGPALEARAGDTVLVFRVSQVDHDVLIDPHYEPLLLGAAFAALSNTEDSEWAIESDESGVRVPGSAIGNHVARDLDSAGIKLWDDPEWDPMRAATRFVSFVAPERIETDDDS